MAAGGIVLHPALNIGIAVRSGTLGTSVSGIAEASVALAGLNKIGVGLTAFGNSSAQSRAALELTMEAALRRALGTGGITACMQPEYRIADARIIGAEVLARWTWDDHAISLDVFVGLAERTGLVAELSRQMRQHAFRHLPQFVSAVDDGPWRTWVNVSPREMIDTGFTYRLLSELESGAVDPTRIGLEVTETALLADPKAARNTLCELRRSGVAIALDDFGTGYSSLALLRDIEVDVVKIDRSFTAALPTDSRVAAIVAGIISSVTMMGAAVVAEGVETTEQFEWLAAAGCHTAQGFLLADPVPALELLEMMGPTQLDD